MAMQEPHVSRLVWEGFRQTWGQVTTLLSIGFTILAFWAGKESKIAVGWFVLAATLGFVIVMALVQALLLAVREMRPPPAKVVKAVAAYAPYEHASAICVVATSEPLPKGASLSFHVVEDGVHERCIGFGPVVLVQRGGSVLVALDVTYDGADHYVSEMLKPESGILQRLVVRPGLDSSEVEFIGERRKRLVGNRPPDAGKSKAPGDGVD